MERAYALVTGVDYVSSGGGETDNGESETWSDVERHKAQLD